jgi:hypothetical protein
MDLKICTLFPLSFAHKIFFIAFLYGFGLQLQRNRKQTNQADSSRHKITFWGNEINVLIKAESFLHKMRKTEIQFLLSLVCRCFQARGRKSQQKYLKTKSSFAAPNTNWLLMKNIFPLLFGSRKFLSTLSMESFFDESKNRSFKF